MNIRKKVHCGVDPQSAYDVGAASNRGARTRNEDAYFVAALQPSMAIKGASEAIRLGREVRGPEGALLMIVADGMGGLSRGELASRLAIEGAACFALKNIVHPLPQWPSARSPESKSRLTVPGLRTQLAQAIDESDQCVRRCTGGDGEMGSTITLAYIVWPVLYIAHVGDTRAYVLRGGKLKQITRDHTVGQRLHEQAPLEPSSEYWRHVLWNSLGATENVAQAEVTKTVLEPHDRWLLCSDGLYSALSSEELASIMLSHGEAKRCAAALVKAALEKGATDNVTAICGARQLSSTAQFEEEKASA